MTDAATAFVPAHVTGFFTTDPDPDPTKAGSRGGGLALEDGVSVTVERADDAVTLDGTAADASVNLDGTPADVDAVEEVLGALGVTAAVEAESDVPVGSGFGVSGALALGTALAANAAFECALSENELVALAHGADVRAGTGLGDVVAQARGGVPLRLEAGGPPHGELDAVPARPRVEYLVLGRRSTKEALSGDTGALTVAGERALSLVLEEPTLERFMRGSRQFVREADLLTEEVSDVVQSVADHGGSASMALLGETVFSTGHGLTDAGYDATATRVHPGGAHLVG